MLKSVFNFRGTYLFLFLFMEVFINILINNTNTCYITKHNTGHDNTIQYAADSIYNDKLKSAVYQEQCFRYIFFLQIFKTRMQRFIWCIYEGD